MSIKPENRKFYSKEWKEIRLETIIERGNLCEICDKTSREKILTVHHRDRNPANNNPENLLVCCQKHHFDEERKINAGYYNIKQMELF